MPENTENRKLDSIVKIDGENYEVVAARLANGLSIKTINDDGTEATTTFDGSQKDMTIDIGNANKIKVKVDNGTEYATITISSEDPVASEGSTGNIWFKY